jgi:hypothetical protein
MGKYDKLIKENLRYLVPSLARRMGIDLVRGRLETIKDKLQYTVEREPDFLFKVCYDDPSEDYIAQFDFQSGNDDNMPERMLFYRCLGKFVHQLPIRQIVFYIGNDPMTMVNFIDEPNLYYEYELYDIRIFPANWFLESSIPQEVLLAILGDFEGETPEIMMEKIILRLKKVSKRKKDFQKFTRQLCVLTELRKLRPLFNKKVKTMPVLFDIDFKNDPFYLEGHVEGREEGIELGVKKQATLTIENLLMQKIFSVDSIANISNQTEAFVLSIKRRLIQEGKLPAHG